MEEQKENKIGYKIEANRPYKIIRSEFKDKVFYKINVSKKDLNGATVNAFKNVKFHKGVDLPDGTVIKIKKAFEDFYFTKKDIYNPVWLVFITDYELAKSTEEEELEKFNAEEEIDLPF